MAKVRAEQRRPLGQDHLEDAVAAADGSSDWFGPLFNRASPLQCSSITFSRSLSSISANGRRSVGISPFFGDSALSRTTALSCGSRPGVTGLGTGYRPSGESAGGAMASYEYIFKRPKR